VFTAVQLLLLFPYFYNKSTCITNILEQKLFPYFYNKSTCITSILKQKLFRYFYNESTCITSILKQKLFPCFYNKSTCITSILKQKLFPYFYKNSITSILKQNRLRTGSFNFYDIMNNKLITMPTTHSWLEEEIRFNSKDVVEPQEGNWIHE
jgi:hypothetical protein